jgi:crotonobetainyl-CoA:carnitine CoA-transferase CaiB-like acyl-CoA transferase
MLKKLKVIAFSHFVQGPSGSQYLSDLGADVIKIEPLAGAWERHRKPPGKISGYNATHVALNRNKRSLAIDLKSKEAKDIIYALAKNSHAVVENYRVGVLDRLGFGYEAIKAIKPDIIYVSATGWGSVGPMHDKPGQDIMAQARSGLIGVTGPRPTPVGAPVVDQHGGALLALSVLAGYARWNETGEGSRIETNLLTAGLDLQSEAISIWFAEQASAANVERQENLATWYNDAPYGVYAIADGWVVISTGPNAGKLPEALNCGALQPFAYADRMVVRDEYAAILANELKSWTWEKLDAALAPHGVWYQRVTTNYDELLSDPQVIASEVFTDVQLPDGHSMRLVNNALRCDGETLPIRRIPFEIGHDTRDILSEIGFTSSDIEGLVEAGVVAAPQMPPQMNG